MTEHIKNDALYGQGNFLYKRRLPGDFSRDNRPDQIAEYLSTPEDLDKVIKDFDDGETDVRDVARFTDKERAAIITAGRDVFLHRHSHSILEEDPYVRRSVEEASYNFGYFMMHPSIPGAQSFAGWNFTVHTRGMRDAGFLWAQKLDSTLTDSVQGETRSVLDALYDMGSDRDTDLRKIWNAFSKQHPNEVAWYLSERSLQSEEWQTNRYESYLVDGKEAAARLINNFSRRFNLPTEYQDRALLQLNRAKFGAFDHLVGGVTSMDGTLGDYQAGTLRVRTKLGGSTAQPSDAKDPLGTTTHELLHASSAQSNQRVGLMLTGGQGTDINEGMTEMLKLSSLDRIQVHNNQIVFMDYQNDLLPVSRTSRSYDTQVKALYAVMENHSEEFRALFHAYYGSVPDAAKLRDAVEVFNHYAESIFDASN